MPFRPPYKDHYHSVLTSTYVSDAAYYLFGNGPTAELSNSGTNSKRIPVTRKTKNHLSYQSVKLKSEYTLLTKNIELHKETLRLAFRSQLVITVGKKVR